PPPAHRADHRRSLGHQRHPRLQGPSIPRRPSKPTWRSSPGDEHYDPARSTASPPTRNGPSSSATSNAGRSPPAPAAAHSAHRASTNTPASAARCSGPTPPNETDSPRSATTSPPASPRPNAKNGSERSKD